jgi:hypothetical protein
MTWVRGMTESKEAWHGMTESKKAYRDMSAYMTESKQA